MWKVPVSIPGFGNVNYPSICPLSPKHGHAFCEKHCMKDEQLGFPSGLREFYQRSGVSKADIDKGIQLYYRIKSCNVAIFVAWHLHIKS